jgi:hypothetical protein
MMKSTVILPFAAALMLSTAAFAQDATTPPATDATPPAVTDPAPTTPAPAMPETPPAAQAPAEIPAPTADNATAPVLTDDQAKALKNKVIWSSDEKNVGEVAKVIRDGDGRVQELHADIGGFLGFGETRVRVAAEEFKMVDDRIILTRTEQQVEALPEVIEN